MRRTLKQAILATGLFLVATPIAGLAATPASAEVVDTTPPSTPTAVRQVGPTQNMFASSIEWNASSDNFGTIAYYVVYAAMEEHQMFTRAFPTTTSLPVLGIAPPITHFPEDLTARVTVYAVDGAGNVSAPSAPVDVVINDPSG